ncbi:hypothetical protein DMH88_09140 [Escherichia coli]|nr:hypothetical protein [Escherichia coli]
MNCWQQETDKCRNMNSVNPLKLVNFRRTEFSTECEFI